MAEPKVELISQGSYGCIFRPGFNCKGKPIKHKQNNQYITKVQKIASTSNRETRLGKIIKKLVNHEDYFAPILTNCEVTLARIDNDKIKRCDFIEDDEKTYETNKIRYVGKNTLATYILNVVEDRPKQLFRVLLDTHIHLLKGFDKLYSAGIVHLDVKENNIMIDDNTKTPIIIDFGLSSEITALNTNNYRDVFFVYSPDYSPWCIDTCMLSYMANELKNEIIPPGMLGFIGFEKNKAENWLDGMVTNEKITKVITDFITKNTAMIEILNETQRKNYKNTLEEYFGKFVGKTWKDVADELEQNASTWDCYAVSIMYSYIIQDLELNNVDMKIPSWISYKKTLEDAIMSPPDKRASSKEMITKIEDVFTNISSNENKDMMKILDNIKLSKEKKMNIRTNILNTKQKLLQRETKIYDANIERV